MSRLVEGGSGSGPIISRRGGEAQPGAPVWRTPGAGRKGNGSLALKVRYVAGTVVLAAFGAVAVDLAIVHLMGQERAAPLSAARSGIVLVGPKPTAAPSTSPVRTEEARPVVRVSSGAAARIVRSAPSHVLDACLEGLKDLPAPGGDIASRIERRGLVAACVLEGVR